MGQGYAQIAFTPAVQQLQRAVGSFGHYGTMAEDGRDDSRLGDSEAAFLAERESFYLASVNPQGWPYIQHRGGPPGFVQVLEDGASIAFAELVGNRQLVSAGNLAESDKVALFFMDYAGRHRLKLFGHARLIASAEVPELVARLPVPPRGRRQAVMQVQVAGWEWNCPQHIPQLIPLAQAKAGLQQLAERVAALEAENARLRGEPG